LREKWMILTEKSTLTGGFGKGFLVSILFFIWVKGYFRLF